jgi:hypothetical protein
MIAVFGEQVEDLRWCRPPQGPKVGFGGRIEGHEQRGLVERERRRSGEFVEPNFPAMVAEQVFRTNAHGRSGLPSRGLPRGQHQSGTGVANNDVFEPEL